MFKSIIFSEIENFILILLAALQIWANSLQENQRRVFTATKQNIISVAVAEWGSTKASKPELMVELSLGAVE